MGTGVSSPGVDALGRVDRVQVQHVEDLIAAAVRRIRVMLVNRLGVGVPVRFGEVGNITFGELTEQFLSEGAGVFVTYSFEPGGHRGLLAIDGALLYRIMGLLLGEDPHGEPAPFVWRAPTRMDLAIAERLAADIFEGVLESLPPGTGGRLRIDEVTANPRVRLPYGPSMPMWDVTLDFGPPQDPFGLVTLALPSTFAETVWPRPARPMIAPDEGTQRVLSLPVSLVAELGRISLPLGEVHAMSEGTLLPLSMPREVVLSVAGHRRFIAEAGVVDGQRCVRVVRKPG